MKRLSALSTLCLPLLIACSDSPKQSDLAPAPSADMAMPERDLYTPPSQSDIAGEIAKSTTLSGIVTVTDSLTIDAGVTLTLAPDTTLLIATGKSITVKGTLLGQGQSGKPVRLRAKTPAGAGSWGSLLVQNGGTVTLTYAELHDASTAFQASGGSTFSIDHLLIDSSLGMLLLQSSGSISHAVLHGLGTPQQSDPVVVQDASPHLTDVLIDSANQGADMVAVNGATSGPVFDHVEVTQSHCAFHFNEGSKATISGSYVHDNVYGLMVIYSKSTQVSGSNFVANYVNIGSCASGGSVTATGVFFDNKPAFDSECLAQTNATPAANTVPGAGPRP
jgi:hypothetical protein